MNQEQLSGMIIDYIDGKLNTIDRQVIEMELAKKTEAYKLYVQLKEVMKVMDRSEELEPSAKLRNNFDTFLKAEIELNKNSKTVFFSPTWYRVAAAVALLIIGGGTGYWISQQNQQHNELIVLQKEMEETRRLVLAQMNNDQSASQRMLGVMAAYESVQANKPDDEIVEALVTSMNTDGNSNVRLAAVEALSKFTAEEKVRRALIESLATQNDPVIQIALIQLLVQMKEKNAMKSFKQIIEDEKSLPAVKDEAHAGIFKLS
ncbi:MAG: HEAT repeat domain-containing protein [Cyclobacteriaceae bacterium]|nr:HEAT repeat domain-containing protein [Cyclobacteriaceae bacterium]UYN87456.1 MAG: HEAT repeat domain-containing protein [Cyclobacteriaceae bacterium]